MRDREQFYVESEPVETPEEQRPQFPEPDSYEELADTDLSTSDPAQYAQRIRRREAIVAYAKPRLEKLDAHWREANADLSDEDCAEIRRATSQFVATERQGFTEDDGSPAFQQIRWALDLVTTEFRKKHNKPSAEMRHAEYAKEREEQARNAHADHGTIRFVGPSR